MPQITDKEIISTIIEMTKNGEADNLNGYLENLTSTQKALAAANDNQALQIAASLEGVKAVSIIKSLLDIQAVRDNAGAGNNATLNWAITAGHPDIAQGLLTFPAVYNASLDEAAGLALSMDYTDISSTISANMDIILTLTNMAQQGDNAGLTALLASLTPEQKLLAAANNNRALQLAAIHGHDQTVRILLTIPIVWDNAAAGSNLALFMALRLGYRSVAQALLNVQTVRANAAVYNNAPLKCAAINDYGEIVKELLTISAVNRCSAADNENKYEAIMLSVSKCCSILRGILNFLKRDGQVTQESLRFEQDFLVMHALRDTDPTVISLHQASLNAPRTGATQTSWNV